MNKPKLDYKKMLEDILKLVDNDWAFDMSCKTLEGSKPYTQKEAHEMALCIGTVYSVAHCLYCTTCAGKYLLNKMTQAKELKIK